MRRCFVIYIEQYGVIEALTTIVHRGWSSPHAAWGLTCAEGGRVPSTMASEINNMLHFDGSITRGYVHMNVRTGYVGVGKVGRCRCVVFGVCGLLA